MDNNGVLVIITSSLCGGCKAFKPSLATIEKDANRRGIKYLFLEEQHASGRDMYGPSGKYPSLGPINWYPFIFYTNRDTLDAIAKGTDKRDKIKILNGKFEASQFKLTSNQLPNALTVANWLDNITNSPIIHDNNEWTKESSSEILKPRSSSRSENSNNIKIVPRRKYGHKGR